MDFYRFRALRSVVSRFVRPLAATSQSVLSSYCRVHIVQRTAIPLGDHFKHAKIAASCAIGA
eukprot:8435569-Alexandrium_andersonii.AAC.1